MDHPNQVQDQLNIAVRTDATVLITGPTGTGKSRLARAIHDRSGRRYKPFVTVNLATLHEGTLESELFGHERGAFTSADQRRVGRVEAAQGGTVFLDEVGELPPRLQARLLDLLQSRTITPVGGNRELRLDVRIIAATHRDLMKAVERGEFREDLFHRLRFLEIRLPSLVERWEDFDEVVHSCLAEICAEQKRSILKVSLEVAERLERHSWPGNFRELRNVLEYAVLASDGAEIRGADLPPWFGRSPGVISTNGIESAPVLGVAEFPLALDYYGALGLFEKEYLNRALIRFDGRVNRTAREIGINKTTLIRRMRAHGIKANSSV